MAEHVAKQDLKKKKKKKRRVQKRVQKWTSNIFTVQGVAASEQVVFVQFGGHTRQKFGVVKLDIKTLPRKDAEGRKIHWINNFAIIDAGGHYVKEKVHYTLFLPEPYDKQETFVYYADGELKWDKKPRRKGSQQEQPGLLQVDFTTGDPGPGWT